MADTRTSRILQDMEGFSGVDYHDATGRSIGFGHFLTENDPLKGKTLSRDQALRVLDRDIDAHQKDALKYLKVQISENEKTALTLLAFNAGPGAAQSVVKLLNKGDKTAAAAKFGAYIRSRAYEGAPLLVNPELVKRREYERRLFQTPDGAAFDEKFRHAPAVKTKVAATMATTATAKQSQPLSAAAYSGTADAAASENLRVLAELRVLRSRVSTQAEDFDEFERRLRAEGRGA